MELSGEKAKQRNSENNMGEMQKESETQEELENASKVGCREHGEQARQATGICHVA